MKNGNQNCRRSLNQLMADKIKNANAGNSLMKD